MVGAEFPLGDPQRPLEVGPGLGRLPQLQQDKPEVVRRLQRLGVVGAELPLGGRQGSLRLGAGRGRIASRRESEGEDVQRVDDPCVICRKGLLGDGEGLLMGAARGSVQSAIALIRACDDQQVDRQVFRAGLSRPRTTRRSRVG